MQYQWRSNPLYVLHLSYFPLHSCKINQSSETMRAEIIKLYKILLDADNSLCFAHYKFATNEDPEIVDIITDSTMVLNSPVKLPSSVTLMDKFFFVARPNSKGGVIWAQVSIIRNKDICDIITDTRNDLKEPHAQLFIQSIQHYDVAPLLGVFKHLHPDTDVVHFSAFLSSELDKIYPDPKLKIGLQVKTPYDGKKRDSNMITNYRDRIQAFHINAEGNYKDQTGKLLKHIFCSVTFKERYNYEICLVTPFDRHGSSRIQDKIRKCIV